MLIIPAIDLRRGQCVRLTQGRKADIKVYSGDPVEMARRFEKAGARWLHVVDLDGAFNDDEGGPQPGSAVVVSESSNREVARRIIQSVKIPVQFGGGLRTVSDVQQMIENGAARVVIGTMAVEAPSTLEKLLQLYGEKVAVGIDARDGYAVTRGWEKQEETSALELARRMAELGVRRIIYTDVSRDGTLTGANVEQTKAVAIAAGIPVTASGGVVSLADIERLQAASTFGIDSVIIGKALYEGHFTLEEALESCATRNPTQAGKRNGSPRRHRGHLE